MSAHWGRECPLFPNDSHPHINVVHNEQESRKDNNVDVEDEKQPPNLKDFEVAMITMQLQKKDTNWYLDSGASAHVTGDIGNLTNVKKEVDATSNVKSAPGHTHKVHGKGKAVVAHHGEIKIVNNVLYVPSVKTNLLSVGALANMGCVVVFGKYKCWISQLPNHIKF
ncbi:hypothetical protein CY35_10G024000 [Sphagnum magellanicum]|nr:hypothetical protein CY35_10G024000 [Sphagnum magellanicum]